MYKPMESSSGSAWLVHSYLKELLGSIHYPPHEAWVVDDENELSHELQRQIRRFRDRGTQWCAWRNEFSVWLVEATMLVGPDAILLLVVFYNNHGGEESAGVWAREPGGRWHLMNVVEPAALWRRGTSEAVPGAPAFTESLFPDIAARSLSREEESQ